VRPEDPPKRPADEQVDAGTRRETRLSVSDARELLADPALDADGVVVDVTIHRPAR